jgi:hypothetical protein
VLQYIRANNHIEHVPANVKVRKIHPLDIPGDHPVQDGPRICRGLWIQLDAGIRHPRELLFHGLPGRPASASDLEHIPEREIKKPHNIKARPVLVFLTIIGLER